MDKLRAMRTFVAIARAGSLSAAAREMGCPLTNVSRDLGQLEAALGAVLVIRSPRRLELTPDGRDYLAVCRLLLDDLEQAEQRIGRRSSELSGLLTITAPETFGRLHLLPVLTRFLAAHPRIDARLRLEDRQINMVEEGVDVALRIGALPDSAHIATLVGHQHLLTCAAPAYLARHGAPAAVGDLAAHACICFLAPPGGLRWVFASREGGRQVVRLRPRLTVNSAEAAVEAAAAGLGIARVLAYQAAGAIAAGRLVPLLPGADETRLPVHLLRWPHRTVPARVRDFIRFAAEPLRARQEAPPGAR